MPGPHQTPPFWRVLVALLVAPTVAAFVAVGLSSAWDALAGHQVVGFGFVELFKVALAGAIAGTILAFLLGLPVYILLMRRTGPTAVRCALTGAAIALAPSVSFTVMILRDLEPGLAWRVATDVRAYLSFGPLGVGGAAGGLVFWLIVTAGLMPKRADEA